MVGDPFVADDQWHHVAATRDAAGTLVMYIDGIDVVVGSRRSQTFDPEPFLALGIDVSRYRYVALKSSNHFRAGFTELAGAIVTADPPGLCTNHIETFERQRASRPMWPINAQASFHPD